MPLILDGTKGETFPSWTTAGRPTSPVAGQTGYNTTLATLERYNGTTWGPVVTTSDTGTVTAGMLSTGAPSWTSGGVLQFNSGFGSVANAYGCRAWVNFNGTGTVAIRASANVTSITDVNTGLYSVNFTTSLPDGNYCPVVSGSRDGLSSFVEGITEPYNINNTNFGVACLNATINGYADYLYVVAAVFR